ncbi:MAG: hypothetical protein F6K30_18880, partial [Cyanothece sp. SIO2G6]|nr:hypothetical protein [Cyanothece sp. SIO2G6]
MIAIFVLVSILGVLGWRLYLSLPQGRLGLLAWVQALILVLPLIIFLGASILAVKISLIAILILLLAGTGVYIWLGREIRISPTPPSQVDIDSDPHQAVDPSSEALNVPNQTSSEGDLSDISVQAPTATSSTSLNSGDGDSDSSDDDQAIHHRLPDDDLQQIQTIFSR